LKTPVTRPKKCANIFSEGLLMSQEAESGFWPLVDFVDALDNPLAEFLPVDGLGVLDEILVTSVWTDLDESGFTLGAEFRLGRLGTLGLPGLSQFKLSLNPDALAEGRLFLGDDPYLMLKDIEVSLQVAPEILRDANGNGSVISAECWVRFDREGFHFLSFGEVSLANARIAGTEIEATLNGMHIDAASSDLLKVRNGFITLPMFKDSAGNALRLTGEAISIGRDGPSGTFKRAAGAPLAFKLGDFDCDIDEAQVRLDRGQLVDVSLTGRLDLHKFLQDDDNDGWVAVEFSIGPNGLCAALSRDVPLLEMKLDGLLDLQVNSIRLESGSAARPTALWLSGSLTPKVDSIEGSWPTLEFIDLGIDAQGGIRLAKGASIATTQPFVLTWNFLKLTVTAFSLQRPEDAPADLELRLSAGVEVIAGLPAGASVDGLVARWSSAKPVSVSFNGIGIHFGTPGGFQFAASVAWNESRQALTGTGHLDIPALDIRLDAVIEAAKDPTEDTNTLFLAAEAELIPGGIPIGTSGLSLYAVSGLLAYNLALKLPNNSPRRFFDAFMEHPVGSFSAPTKWKTSKGSNALGLGVVIGTADDGWLFSARGALMVSFPDLAILLTATGDLLRERRRLNDGGQGNLAAVLAILPAEQLLRLDFAAQWASPPLFETQGAGGGEFRTNRPGDFKIWLGQNPSVGAPVYARAIKLGSEWMLNSEYWFGLDARRQAEAGFRSRFELRAGGSSVYAEIVAHVGGDAVLSWRPEQFEGGLVLRGRARLAAGGLSLTIGLDAGVDVQIDRPLLFEIFLKACIEIDLGFDEFEICLAHAFCWRKDEHPELPRMLHGLSAVPRHWAPLEQLANEVPLGSGIVLHPLSVEPNGSVDLGIVQPHSELVLEFSKSLFIAPSVLNSVALNDVATPYPQSIGSKSGWMAKWSLEGLELVDLTDGRAVDLFGTFTRSPVSEPGKAFSPRPPNTELGLLSSRRFGQDGSLGGGGAENAPPIDCTPKETEVTVCLPLRGLQGGFGLLPNGWLYLWRQNQNPELRDNRYGVGLAPEDEFSIWPDPEIDTLDFTIAPYQPKQPPVAGSEKKVSLSNTPPLRFSDRKVMLLEVCWKVLLTDADGPYQNWTGSSGTEEWTDKAQKQRLLIPGHTYMLNVSMSGQRMRHNGNSGAPAMYQRSYSFTAGRAPDWNGALSRAVEAHYPEDGRRPVYRHYDLIVEFKDSYFRALYDLDDRKLGVRLRDANGLPITTANGEVLLPVQWELGMARTAPAEEWWRKSRLNQVLHPCEPINPPEPGEVVLPIALIDLNLTPHMRYFAEIVAVDNGSTHQQFTPALASWSFTTSRYRTFEEMMRPPPSVPVSGAFQQHPATDRQFDSLAKSFGVPVVHLPTEPAMTPIRVGKNLAYVLIEAPEPMDDEAGRLTITIENQVADLIFNLDRTRLIAALPAPLVLSNSGVIAVNLLWKGGPAGAPRVMVRSIKGLVAQEEVMWQLPLGGLF
jgi:hypothetical protein